MTDDNEYILSTIYDEKEWYEKAKYKQYWSVDRKTNDCFKSSFTSDIQLMCWYGFLYVQF